VTWLLSLWISHEELATLDCPRLVEEVHVVDLPCPHCLSLLWVHVQVVQVFTYMLSPLTSSSEAQADGSKPVENCHPPPGGGSSNGQDIAGWSLKLVMEFCEEVMTLELTPC